MTEIEWLDPELLRQLQSGVGPSRVVKTLSNGRPNWIRRIDERGVEVETEASRKKGSGPQLVEAWMLNTAWHHLRATGSLSNRYLLSADGLNVKRSSAVCALLAHVNGVVVTSSRPIQLEWLPTAAGGS